MHDTSIACLEVCIQKTSWFPYMIAHRQCLTLPLQLQLLLMVFYSRSPRGHKAGHSQWGSPNAVNGCGCAASVLSQVDSRQGFDHPIHFFCMTMHERNTRLCRRSLRHTSHMSLAWRLQSNCSHHTPVAVTHSFDRYQSRAQAFDMGTCRSCFILREFARFSLVRRKTSARRKFPHL